MILQLYNASLPLLRLVAKIGAVVNPKIRRGLEGRESIQRQVSEHYAMPIEGMRVLIHVASYGELEQARPVIAALKSRWPNIHIHLTFFSPSGYENTLGKYAQVDLITYTPFDSTGEVANFLDVVKPDVALFTKYDVWPNMASELARRNVPSLLFSATASDTSGRMLPFAKALTAATYKSLSRIIAITAKDAEQFQALGVDANRVIVGGDTRFDQVIARKHAMAVQSVLPAGLRKRIEEKKTLVFVAGSAWPEDEKIFERTLKLSISRGDNMLAIIAPHEPNDRMIAALEKSYGVNAIRFSKLATYNREPIILVDSIGKLFGLYRESDIALIGGGFGAGLHNVLEAAVWGVPTIVGPRHTKSSEVGRLIEQEGAYEVKTDPEFEFTFWQLAKQADLRERIGLNAARFVEDGAGATALIINEIARLLNEPQERS